MDKARLLLTTVIISILYYSCKKDDVQKQPPVSTNDAALYSFIKNNDFAYYQGSDAIRQPKSNGAHGPFKLRFNAKAASVLDAGGKLPLGAIFPDSSIILKEVYNGNTLEVYAAIMKLKDDPNNGSKWVWAEYKPDGQVLYSITNKGTGCVPCHSGSTNRDLVRSFDLH